MNTPCETWWCRVSVLAAGGLMLLASGCQTMNRAQSGALIGTGMGAITGAMVGAHNGHAEGGALIGAAAGALAGGLIGDAEDAREERDMAYAQAAYAQHTQNAVTNIDVIQLSRSGVSEDVVISSIRSQGGRFDLSPQSIINLKNAGVSDRVILEMQNHGHLSPPPVTTIIAEPRPRVVVVPPPGPRYHFSFGSGPRHRWHHHHHCDW